MGSGKIKEFSNKSETLLSPMAEYFIPPQYRGVFEYQTYHRYTSNCINKIKILLLELLRSLIQYSLNGYNN